MRHRLTDVHDLTLRKKSGMYVVGHRKDNEFYREFYFESGAGAWHDFQRRVAAHKQYGHCLHQTGLK